MRIGVDARLLSERITGIGRYLYEILSRLTASGHDWYLYSHRPLIVGEWNRSNVHVRSLDLSGRLSRMLWAQTILPFWANRDKVDLFWSPAHRLPAMLSPNIRSVVTVHDLVWRHAGDTMRPCSKFLDSVLMPMAIRKASAVIAVSSSTASDVCSELPTCSRKVSVIHLGASKVNVPNSQQVVNSLEVFGEYVLFVGTQEPRKNLHNLLGAYGRLKGVIPHLPTLVIAGGTGWGNVHVNDLVLKFDLQSHVRTLGYVSEAQLSALYEHSMFLAMPSFYEGFGLPIAEAIVHGRPVLTSCTSSMPEVAANAGLYVDPSSIASIEEGLRKLISDPKKLSHLAENARLSAARFDWDKASDKTRKIFEESTKEPLKSSHDYRT